MTKSSSLYKYGLLLFIPLFFSFSYGKTSTKQETKSSETSVNKSQKSLLKKCYKSTIFSSDDGLNDF